MLDILKNTIENRQTASKELILQEALLLGTEQGWHKLTVRNLANRLQYAPPVLYQFFKNKDHLLDALLKAGYKQLHQSLEKAVLQNNEPENKVLGLAMARYDFAIEQRALHALMFSTGAPDWCRARMSKGMIKTHKLLTSLIRDVSKRTDSCNDLVTNFVAIIKGYTFFATELQEEETKSALFGDLEPRDAYKAAMTRFIKSIKAK